MADPSDPVDRYTDHLEETRPDSPFSPLRGTRYLPEEEGLLRELAKTRRGLHARPLTAIDVFRTARRLGWAKAPSDPPCRPSAAGSP